MNVSLLDNPMRKSQIRALAILVIVLVSFATLAPSPAISAVVVHDGFNDKNNTPLASHAPDISPGSGWQIELGKWAIKRGTVREFSKTKERISSDYRALIDTGLIDQSVTASIKFGGGAQFHGVVANYTDSENWIMWFYDGVGQVGDLILGAPNADGEFWELGRVSFAWGKGDVLPMTLNVTSSSITASVDGTVMISRDNPTGQNGTSAGIFLRGGGSSRFENFSVSDVD